MSQAASWIALTNVVRVPPFEPNLKVMVVKKHPLELAQKLVRLLLGKLVDPLGEWAQREDALPTSHGVRPHDWVDGDQLPADILRRPSRLCVDLDVLRVCRSGAEEALAAKGSRKTLEELLVFLGEAVVDLVAGRPEGVAARLWELGEAERCVVRGIRLELDV